MQENQISDQNSAATVLLDGHRPLADGLFIRSAGCLLRIRSNSPPLLRRLRGYFHSVLGEPGPDAMEVIAIEREAVQTGLEFHHWRREPGKTGRKDSYVDLPQARLIRKVRTGMLFLQCQDSPIAAGPCLRHDNQLINFINSQLMNWLQQRQWLICHAAGLVWQGRALGLAGLSGGGKSTLMLHLMDRPQMRYLTNDRLFLRAESRQVQARGIPKLPRVNPGTLVGNPRLRQLVRPDQIAAWRRLAEDDLWQLEEKHDVFLDRIYGPDCIAEQAPLAAFIVLNWDRQDTSPVLLQQVELNRRPDLLAALMKSPGPFYQDASGRFLQADDTQPAEKYLQALAGVPVYEVRGGLDFQGLIPQCLEVLAS
ncbi:MAG: HprK-related kinase B [Gammaproteobacteria bacterium SHHR-1]|uniref:HprK-related kinase B n=1 Tax=Magnetovirga frankeli TaxID=947516 RepID=UPI001293121E|nr:HprK-related kinase B [gamma proteobacterium SS-5]